MRCEALFFVEGGVSLKPGKYRGLLTENCVAIASIAPRLVPHAHACSARMNLALVGLQLHFLARTRRDMVLKGRACNHVYGIFFFFPLGCCRLELEIRGKSCVENLISPLVGSCSDLA